MTVKKAKIANRHNRHGKGSRKTRRGAQTAAGRNPRAERNRNRIYRRTPRPSPCPDKRPTRPPLVRESARGIAGASCGLPSAASDAGYWDRRLHAARRRILATVEPNQRPSHRVGTPSEFSRPAIASNARRCARKSFIRPNSSASPGRSPNGLRPSHRPVVVFMRLRAARSFKTTIERSY